MFKLNINECVRLAQKVNQNHKQSKKRKKKRNKKKARKITNYAKEQKNRSNSENYYTNLMFCHVSSMNVPPAWCPRFKKMPRCNPPLPPPPSYPLICTAPPNYLTPRQGRWGIFVRCSVLLCPSIRRIIVNICIGY